MREIETLQIRLDKYKATLQILSENLCWSRQDKDILTEAYRRCLITDQVASLVQLDGDYYLGHFADKPSDCNGALIVNTANDQIVTDRDEQCVLLIKYFRNEVVRISEEIAKLAVLSGFRFCEHDFRISNKDRIEMFERYLSPERFGRR